LQSIVGSAFSESLIIDNLSPAVNGLSGS